MIAAYSLAANHLWQSTFFAGVAGLLTLVLSKNHARTRHWIWLAASVKFLIPFSLLIAIGSQVGSSVLTAGPAPPIAFAVQEISQPFTGPAVPSVATSTATNPIPAALLAVWTCGFLGVAITWWRGWRRVRAAVRAASPLPLELPADIEVRSSRALLEPGIFGIVRPVLLLPAGITERLTHAQLEAILAHELCHVRRRDNLAAAIHMVVEAIFWFHPLVWWMGARLVEERERACDEEVLRLGSEPEVYAESILKVCQFYLESPLVCVAGVTGADLKKRIEGIMTHGIVHKLDFGRKLLLAIMGIAAVAGPIAIGLVNAPPSRAQSQAGAGASLAFEVASVKPNKSGVRGGGLNTEPGRLTITNMTLRTCIRAAYEVQNYQLTEAPGWLDSERYDIVAKADSPVGDDQLMLMLRSLLADRFKLTLHHITKELPGYALVVGKSGPKLHEVPLAGKGWMRNGVGRLTGQEVSMSRLAQNLSGRLTLPVVDLTGIKGVFEIKLEWTPDPSQQLNPEEAKESPAPESAPDQSRPSIFTALQQQLGLKLEPRKVPGEILVIDHVARPSEN